MSDVTKAKTAYFLGHNGLGDNITNIGAINFLSNYYDKIYFICKDKYLENVKLLFANKISTNKVILIQYATDKERLECWKIIHKAFTDKSQPDIFISGFVNKTYLKSRINNPNIINYKQNNDKYTIKYNHIRDFYNDVKLDLTVYYEYFNIDSTEISLNYYKDICNYNIIFLHTKASNREIEYPNVIEKYVNDDNTILICANKNLYDVNHSKYELANKYVNLLVGHYIDIILNAQEIYVIDSCFACIINPLQITNKLKANIIDIYERKE